MRTNDSGPLFPGFKIPETLIVNFILIEEEVEQIKPINGNQAYIKGNIRITKDFKLSNFRDHAFYEFEVAMKKKDSQKIEIFNEEDYKFALVNEHKEIAEYESINERFFEALMVSSKDLIITNKKYDIKKLLRLYSFKDWFKTYSNTARNKYFVPILDFLTKIFSNSEEELLDINNIISKFEDESDIDRRVVITIFDELIEKEYLCKSTHNPRLYRFYRGQNPRMAWHR